MRLLTKKKTVGVIVSIILLFYVMISGDHQSQNKAASASPSTTQKIATVEAKIRVKRVIDGDTIELENGKKVRYIGIDTPELHHPTKPVQCFGQEAMEINKELVEGKSVRLVKDVSEIDRYGRLLRYVYLDDSSASPSSLFINKYLVEEGYAHVATFPPDVAFEPVFQAAEQRARDGNKGLWSKCE